MDRATDRRRFLRSSSVGAVALAWPTSVDALARRVAAVAEGATAAEGARAPARAQELWELVRAAFLIPDDRIYLNVATLGPQPRAVVDAVLEHTRRVAQTYPPGIDWEALKARLGTFVGADPAGFVFPRNTTEGMNFVANGLELGAGDEILTTTHEHIGGLCCWQLLAARRGCTLRQLPLPVPPTSSDELVDVFRRAVTPRTRVVSVSHVNFTNGVRMPVREIAAHCRERGIISVVDGAHPPGMMRVRIADIAPDFYASSPHKWLLAPQGTGFLWMADEWRTKLWPTLASGGWDDLSLGAHRFNHLGTLDESRLAGLDAALRFQEAIGVDRIEARVRELRLHLYDALAALPRVAIVSPRDDALAAGMVSFSVEGVASLALQQRLSRIDAAGIAWSVRTRVIGEYDYGWMRLSPHIYNSVEEIDRVVSFIAG
jgi:isopenicillin-N epimerase